MVIYVALGALIFFGFYLNTTIELWKDLNLVQKIMATISLLTLWGPVLFIMTYKTLLENWPQKTLFLTGVLLWLLYLIIG